MDTNPPSKTAFSDGRKCSELDYPESAERRAL